MYYNNTGCYINIYPHSGDVKKDFLREITFIKFRKVNKY